MPLATHGKWKPAADRPDPVELLAQQDERREPDLVPVRHGRMLVSPFTFYRGAARIMAADLKDTPRAGLTVQLCGDAHLSNFGVFASPERALLFDVNDFDETLPGPFEYDVRRMAASFTIAGRNNGFGKAVTRAATLASVGAYRAAMAEFAQKRVMEIWYARLSEADIGAAIKSLQRTEKGKAKKAVKRDEKAAAHDAAKAETHDSLQALSKLGELVDGRYRSNTMRRRCCRGSAAYCCPDKPGEASGAAASCVRPTRTNSSGVIYPQVPRARYMASRS